MTTTLPNILTILRLMAAPALALVFIIFARPYADLIALVLFVGASFTDWLDGFLARRWGQESRFGAMLDPIADKAMVVIALAMICADAGFQPVLIIPVAVILFREVFVSGLREYLGAKAGLLKVTQLAKWKTTIQMAAIAVLFANGALAHWFVVRTIGMDPLIIAEVLAGIEPDEVGLRVFHFGSLWSWWGGIALLWAAALLTALTGYDYFRKSLPYLSDT